MNSVNYETAIRRRAYAIWEEEGRPLGREWDHWTRAQQEMLRTPPLAPAASGTKSRKAVKGRIRAALGSAISA